MVGKKCWIACDILACYAISEAIIIRAQITSKCLKMFIFLPTYSGCLSQQKFNFPLNTVRQKLRRNNWFRWGLIWTLSSNMCPVSSPVYQIRRRLTCVSPRLCTYSKWCSAIYCDSSKKGFMNSLHPPHLSVSAFDWNLIALKVAYL